MSERLKGSARPGRNDHRRVVLHTVEIGEASGFVIPSHRYGSTPYRGQGELDYSCGNCGHLLAIGVRPGTFRTVLLACGCGALNKVPIDSYAGAKERASSPWAPG